MSRFSRPHPAGVPRRPPLERLLPSPKLKLLDQCRQVMRFKGLSFRTEQTYADWIRRFVLWCRDAAGTSGGVAAREEKGGWRHPRDCGAEEATSELSHLSCSTRIL